MITMPRTSILIVGWNALQAPQTCYDSSKSGKNGDKSNPPSFTTRDK